MASVKNSQRQEIALSLRQGGPASMWLGLFLGLSFTSLFSSDLSSSYSPLLYTSVVALAPQNWEGSGVLTNPGQRDSRSAHLSR